MLGAPSASPAPPPTSRRDSALSREPRTPRAASGVRPARRAQHPDAQPHRPSGRRRFRTARRPAAVRRAPPAQLSMASWSRYATASAPQRAARAGAPRLGAASGNAIRSRHAAARGRFFARCGFCACGGPAGFARRGGGFFSSSRFFARGCFFARRGGAFRRPRFVGCGSEIFFHAIQVAQHRLVHLLDVAPGIAKTFGHVFAQVFAARGDISADSSQLLLRGLESFFDSTERARVVLLSRVRRFRCSPARGRSGR